MKLRMKPSSCSAGLHLNSNQIAPTHSENGTCPNLYLLVKFLFQYTYSVSWKSKRVAIVVVVQ